MSTDHTTFGSVSVDWAAEPVPNMAGFDGYEAAREGMEWSIPDRFNLATDVVTGHVEAGRGEETALVRRGADGERHEHTFGAFERRSNELAGAFAAVGVGRGDRVAIVGSRSDLVMAVHLAAWKLGAVSVPLSTLYGPDGLAYRLGDCEPTVVVADTGKADAVASATADLEAVEAVVGLGGVPDPVPDGVAARALADLAGPDDVDPVETAPDDPAMILYTSGTTGRPKGVLQGHRALIGWLPGFQLCFELPWHDVTPRLYATPDLAWVGGLNLVLGAWHYGFPAFRDDTPGGFDPAAVLENVEAFDLTHAVLVPAMLKPMSELDHDRFDLSSLTVVMSGSEPVTESVYRYVTDTLDANLNEMYGQTEAMHVVTTCNQWFDVEPGSMGFPVPGHEVAIVDEDGRRKDDGEVGIIGLERPDPAMFLELWEDPEGTDAKFVDGWMNTDDLGYADEDGRLWYKSRADNLIISRGYRIGPAEVEDSIVELDAVANVGVVGVPAGDGEGQGELVKAFVRLAEGYDPTDATREHIQDHVRDRLAAYQYPREIEFVDQLPTTVTGKIQRHELRRREERDG